MLCGRMVKRKLNERDNGRGQLTDDSQWQDHLALKRSRVMEESAMRDCPSGCTQPGEDSRMSRGEDNLKMTGTICLFAIKMLFSIM